ncbi:hypothetical protein AGMMS49949_03710 [Alphaproteobacteria bacterium]|nr:hypothetical protein AGMMS49949_03710 [Alphaproteobacteria bacterium]GHS96566.1 hypothetical protein AGMMS50296_2850 [Alphaproteobacteria bacterium]
MTFPAQSVRFIDKSASLQSFCGQIMSRVNKRKESTEITVDTEFVRRTTYFPELALIQVGTKTHAAVIDVTALTREDLQPLWTIFLCPKILKIFHSARQDYEALYHAFGILPSPLFDTQIAAAMMGYGASVGYEALVKSVLGGSLDKKCQTSPCLKGPFLRSKSFMRLTM